MSAPKPRLAPKPRPDREPAIATPYRPAFYASKAGPWGDWWTLLHPHYTAWHLSYVVMGAALAPRFELFRLAATLLAFFLAVGLAAHALDEYQGRPLRTTIPDRWLLGVAAVGLLGALALGIAGLAYVGWALLPFMLVGVLLVLAYNLELFGGLIHTDIGFAAAWGSFPFVTAYFAQTSELGLVTLLGAAASFGLTYVQRVLSNRARLLRRRATAVTGQVTLVDGELDIDREFLLAPLESALHALSWTAVLLALTLLASRLLRALPVQS